MLETILKLDQELLFFLNKDISNPVFDWFFPAITDLHKTWFFLYLIIPAFAIFLWRNYQRVGVAIFLGLIFALSIADLFGSKLVKPFFSRPRPPVAGLDVIVRAPYFSQNGFYSNHATNIFCAAVFLSFFFPSKKWIFYFIAVLISFSRIYCGVHYPGDVICGGIVGAVIGFFAAHLVRLLMQSKKRTRVHG